MEKRWGIHLERRRLMEIVKVRLMEIQMAKRLVISTHLVTPMVI